MKLWFSISLTTLCLQSALAAGPEGFQAIDASNGKAVVAEKVLLSPKNASRNFIDTHNLRVEIAPGASGYFDANGVFHLLRGSAIIQAPENREVRTVNSTMNIHGKTVISYDFREQSSSIFVLFGKAIIENSTNPVSKKNLLRNEGATLVTGAFYPDVIRNLDFASAEEWLKHYGWAPQKRSELLVAVPTKTVARKLASIDENSPHNAALKQELFSYFPVDQEKAGPKKYEKEYTSSALRGLEHSALEEQLNRGDEIEIITPEQAAVIVLPEIDLGTDIRMSAQLEESARNPKKANQRKPASLVREKDFKPMEHPKMKAAKKAQVPAEQTSNNAEVSKQTASSPVMNSDPAISSALDRLNQVEKDLASGEPEAEHERQWSDLQQNF